jgi:hydroxymethylpyrimidine pyrophosphatase-like HAD family hydrolase
VVNILEEPPTWKAVMGFDFDDTLMLGIDHKERIDPQFFDCLRWVRANYGAAWGICTGRSLPQLMEGFNDGKFPFLPDFVVVREREIYFPGQFGRWMPHEKWNKNCDKDHKKLFKKHKRNLAKVRKFVEGQTDGCWVSHEGDPAGVVAASDEEMNRVIGFYESLSPSENLCYERNGIYLRFTHSGYRKGTCLVEAAARWGIGPELILAVGDNYNDLSMLRPEVCGACGCPSNAVDAVKKYILGRGGKVSQKPGSLGVMNILGHYFNQ